MGIIHKERNIQVPGLDIKSWLDDSKIKQVTDKDRRSTWIRAFILHTVHGKLGTVKPGKGPPGPLAERYANYQTNTDRDVSWDYTEDLDGSFIVQNDPTKFYTWQAGAANRFTLGMEMVQEENGDLYSDQIDKAVQFIDAITALNGIQRVIPWNTGEDKPITKKIDRLETCNDFVGVLAHYHQTTNRGLGDPGPHIFYALKAAGYKLFDPRRNEEKDFWKAIQRSVGMSVADVDGVPGPKTRRLLRDTGRKHGMIVQRPMDSLIEIPEEFYQ